MEQSTLQPPPPSSLVYRAAFSRQNPRPLVNCARLRGAGRRLRQRLPSYTSADHLKLAGAHHDAAEEAQGAWVRLLDVAAQETWGRPFEATDYHVSGCANAAFSPTHQEALRNLAHLVTAHRDCAALHEAAARVRS